MTAEKASGSRHVTGTMSRATDQRGSCYFAAELQVEKSVSLGRPQRAKIYLSLEYDSFVGTTGRTIRQEVSECLAAHGMQVTADRKLTSKSSYLLLLCPGVFSNESLQSEWGWLIADPAAHSVRTTHRHNKAPTLGRMPTLAKMPCHGTFSAKNGLRKTQRAGRTSGASAQRPEDMARPKVVALASAQTPFQSYIRDCPLELQQKVLHHPWATTYY